MQKKEAPYWLAFAHMPKWGYAKINSLIVKFFHDEKISIEDFFYLSEHKWRDTYGLITRDVDDLLKAKAEIPNFSFLAESILNEGYDIIPLSSEDYSPTLKSNLKASHSPPVIYIKGNKLLLKENSIAIVGSRAASETSLLFTDNIARKAAHNYQVVVSGFAKGVDKQALDSALKYNGQSMIVLPQGILTFNSGFKTYYKQISGGDVLVLSTFFPKSPWRAELAMARNPIIYGLANEIYVAESSEKGGTWSGVMDGLKKKRKIYVRMSDLKETNANNLLIQNGAIAVDFEGKEIVHTYSNDDSFALSGNLVNDPLQQIEKPAVSDNSTSIEKKILSVFNGTPLTAKEISLRIGIDISLQKLGSILKKMPELETVKSGKISQFKLKKSSPPYQHTLFD